jgi:hypothetical protein
MVLQKESLKAYWPKSISTPTVQFAKKSNLQANRDDRISFKPFIAETLGSKKDNFSGMLLIGANLAGKTGHAVLLIMNQKSNQFVLFDNNLGYYRFPSLDSSLENLQTQFEQLYKMDDSASYNILKIDLPIGINE